MPPLQALVALHGLWALALLLVSVWAARKWPPLRLKVVGHALSVLGLVALAIVIGRELLIWYPAVASAQQEYIGQRIVYVLVTNTDLPMTQVILAGIALWFASRRQRRDVSLPRVEPLRHPQRIERDGAS